MLMTPHSNRETDYVLCIDTDRNPKIDYACLD